MNSYTGLHAALYDEIYRDKPYAAEAQFVHEFVSSPGRRLLDVACGTGRHALAFAELGYEVTGVDINEDLLALAHNAAGDRVRFVAGDMRALHVDGGPFDVVTCLFDSIGYAQDNEDVIASLRSLRRHVRADGVVFCEFLHSAAVLCGSSPVRVRRWALPTGGSLIRVSETTLDVERMEMHVQYELLAVDGQGRVDRNVEVQVNRFFSAPEMRLLAASAGLDTRVVVPAYSDGPIDTNVFHLMLVAVPAQ